ncbi:MAG: hypothetical protein HZC17_00180 [Candidatus Omnitrophica bacterium]|nr:hypothetical protein [Candidatus Omnitrophota bacterium]
MMVIEKLLKEAFKDCEPKSEGRCLTEEDIACVLDGALDRKQRKILVKHIISCAPCAERLREDLSISRAVQSQPLIEVPEHVLERAKSIVPAEARQNLLNSFLGLQ